MIVCNGHQFSSQSKLENYTRNLIKSIGICSSVKEHNIDSFNFFIDLFKRHPNYPEKIKDLIDIKINPNKIKPYQFELNIVRVDNTLEDISWISCISGKKKDSYLSAMRVSIQDQIDEFRQTHIVQCADCKRNDKNVKYEVDHVQHFEALKYDFENINQHLKRPTTFENTDDNRKQFIKDNKEYEEAWKSYHKTHAKLQFLCKPCHTKKPNWKCPKFETA